MLIKFIKLLGGEKTASDVLLVKPGSILSSIVEKYEVGHDG
ncbi:hypothetical protein l11_22190 [Neisseria weaveri LMG 5135]|nr:hypothetical protein l11_22190 [Neisseria weaveri LMG 5135]EGV37629.1 hypothetical protein l13_03200 [Neisseria weaveri ATCC 51223]